MSDEVMIAVDPHKASNTAAVLDPVTKTLIETARFANSDEGYARLRHSSLQKRRDLPRSAAGSGLSHAARPHNPSPAGTLPSSGPAVIVAVMA